MAYTTPTTRATNDLITAAIWNADMVENVKFLHDRVITQYAPVLNADDLFGTGNRLSGKSLDTAGDHAYFTFHAPAEFATVSGIHILGVGSATGTFTYDLISSYGANGEAAEAHSTTLTAQNLSITNAANTALSILGAFGSLAALDYCHVRLSYNSGSAFRVYALKFAYVQL